MGLVILHDKERIKEYLAGQEKGNFAFYYNNLNHSYWDATQWFGLCKSGKIQALAMLINLYDPPALIATNASENDHYYPQLLQLIKKIVPRQLYCHLNVNTAQYLAASANRAVCRFLNMKLSDNEAIRKAVSEKAVQLTESDLPAISKLLREGHPEHLFKEEFLAGGYFWGIKRGGEIISLAGTNAHSEDNRIVAIGPVVTHPDYRQRGYALEAVTGLLQFLAPNYEHIVLNVKENNIPAVNCYQKLGFRKIGVFEEVVF